jgi:putative ABC transport system permease protein
VVIIAAALGIFAAVWPAWRAGRMNVLDAIHTE